MTKKTLKEWYIDALWGKIAMLSWGNPDNPPVLMVHGFMDTAATFTYLIDKLPDSFYYVSFDLPSHGKSDPFPAGPLISVTTLVEAVRTVVDHMKWNIFLCVSHSLGFAVVTLYNCLYPGKVIKFVGIDPVPALAEYYDVHYDKTYQVQVKYQKYYENYRKVFKPNNIVKLIMKHRGVSEEQAKVLVSRALIPTGNGNYRFLTAGHFSEDILYATLSQHAPPTLIIEADYDKKQPEMNFASNLLNKCSENLQNYKIVKTEGNHNVHVISPGVISKFIIEYFNKPIINNKTNGQSKL